MEEKKKPTKKKVFKKNYFLKGVGNVGKGTVVTPEHKKASNYSDKLIE